MLLNSRAEKLTPRLVIIDHKNPVWWVCHAPPSSESSGTDTCMPARPTTRLHIRRDSFAAREQCPHTSGLKQSLLGDGLFDTCWRSLRRKQRQRYSLTHRRISGRRRMQVIATVECRQQSLGMFRIARDLVEVEQCIEIS